MFAGEADQQHVVGERVQDRDRYRTQAARPAVSGAHLREHAGQVWPRASGATCYSPEKHVAGPGKRLVGAGLAFYWRSGDRVGGRAVGSRSSAHRLGRPLGDGAAADCQPVPRLAGSARSHPSARVLTANDRFGDDPVMRRRAGPDRARDERSVAIGLVRSEGSRSRKHSSARGTRPRDSGLSSPAAIHLCRERSRIVCQGRGEQDRRGCSTPEGVAVPPLLLRTRSSCLAVSAWGGRFSIKAAARGVRPHARHSPTAARRRCHTWSADGCGAVSRARSACVAVGVMS